MGYTGVFDAGHGKTFRFTFREHQLGPEAVLSLPGDGQALPAEDVTIVLDQPDSKKQLSDFATEHIKRKYGFNRGGGGGGNISIPGVFGYPEYTDPAEPGHLPYWGAWLTRTFDPAPQQQPSPPPPPPTPFQQQQEQPAPAGVPGQAGTAPRAQPTAAQAGTQAAPAQPQQETFWTIAAAVVELINAERRQAAALPLAELWQLPLARFTVKHDPRDMPHSSEPACLVLESRGWSRATAVKAADRRIIFDADLTVTVELVTKVQLDYQGLFGREHSMPITYKAQLIAILQELSPVNSYICAGLCTNTRWIEGIKTQTNGHIYDQQGTAVTGKLHSDVTFDRLTNDPLVDGGLETYVPVTETVRPTGLGLYQCCSGLTRRPGMPCQGCMGYRNILRV